MLVHRRHRRAGCGLPGVTEAHGAAFAKSAAFRDERRLDGLALVDADDDQVERDALGTTGCSSAIIGFGRDEGTYNDLDSLKY